jgi:phenylacetate-CoA ligase
LARAADIIPAYRILRGHIPDSDVHLFLQDQVPVVTRDDLRTQRDYYYPNHGRARPWWSIGQTSGTTGAPLDVFRSYDSIRWEHAFHLQHWSWAGLKKGERQVVLRGDLIVPAGRFSPPFWFHDYLGKQLFVSTRHLSIKNAASIAHAIRGFGAVQLRAYPSAAYELARLCSELGLDLRFRSIVTSSEMLYPVQREFIERVLGGKVFDFYGQAERVAFAAECVHGRLHVNPEYSFVEILNENGSPTEGNGFVVGTTLRNLVMPLIRYRLSDSARWNREPCPCGRKYAVLEGISGKIEDRLLDIDGNPVSPSIVTFALKGLSNIIRAQVAQVDRDQWVVRIVPAASYSSYDGFALLENFGKLVSKRLNVRIELRHDIPNLQSGKFKWISQEWKS